MAAVALGLLGAAGGIFWPDFDAMIGAVVLSAIVMALIAFAVERRIAAQANGIKSLAADLSPA